MLWSSFFMSYIDNIMVIRILFVFNVCVIEIKNTTATDDKVLYKLLIKLSIYCLLSIAWNSRDKNFTRIAFNIESINHYVVQVAIFQCTKALHL